MAGIPSRVVLKIDYVVLDGLAVTHHDVVRFRAELAAELGRLFGAAPLLTGWREFGRIHTYHRLASSVHALPTGGTELGRTTARAVHGGLADAAPRPSPAGPRPELRR